MALIAQSVDCKRAGCDGECEKIAGRTLLQMLLMSGIGDVELMVRRNYTDPFILGMPCSPPHFGPNGGEAKNTFWLLCSISFSYAFVTYAGISMRSEECLKKFFVMPPSLITKIFTTYPADVRDQFLADVAALTKHKNTKIASIASSMYPTLVISCHTHICKCVALGE